jgi:hypothetical protein
MRAGQAGAECFRAQSLSCAPLHRGEGGRPPTLAPCDCEELCTRADNVEWQLNTTPDAPSVSVILGWVKLGRRLLYGPK